MATEVGGVEGADGSSGVRGELKRWVCGLKGFCCEGTDEEECKRYENVMKRH